MSLFIWALIIFTGIAIICGALLGFSSVKLKVKSDPISDKIDALLPQSQCGQCGYPGCKPYADAIANGDEINKCVPGGQPLVEQIADLMGVDAPKSGTQEEPTPTVALIHEDMCIGCTKCIQACPVDAIIGTNRALHTVIPDLCTGCELCVPPCPTDCITMEPVVMQPDTWNWRYDLNHKQIAEQNNQLIETVTIEEVTHKRENKGANA